MKAEMDNLQHNYNGNYHSIINDQCKTSTPYVKRNALIEVKLIPFDCNDSCAQLNNTNDLSLTLVTPESSRIHNSYKSDPLSLSRPNSIITTNSSLCTGSSKTWVLTTSNDDSTQLYSDPCTRLAGLILGVLKPLTVGEEIAVAVSGVVNFVLEAIDNLEQNKLPNECSTFVQTIARWTSSFNETNKTMSSRQYIFPIDDSLFKAEQKNLSTHQASILCSSEVTLKTILESVQNTQMMVSDVYDKMKFVCEFGQNQNECINVLLERLNIHEKHCSQISDFIKSELNEVSNNSFNKFFKMLTDHFDTEINKINDVRFESIVDSVKNQMIKEISHLNEIIFARVEARIEQSRKDILRRISLQKEPERIIANNLSSSNTDPNIVNKVNLNYKHCSNTNSGKLKQPSDNEKVEITKRDFDIMQKTIKMLYAENEKLNLQLKKPR